MEQDRILFERTLSGSYMKIRAGNAAAFDEQMLQKQKLSGLLPMEKCYVDGGVWYWYDISGKQSLDTFCRIKPLGEAFLKQILCSVCGQMEILEQHLIYTSCLQLEPELIYIVNNTQEIVFTALPGAEGEVAQGFCALMEYLLTKIDHKDVQAVRLAYEIYEQTLQEGYRIKDIRDAIFAVSEPQSHNTYMKESESQTMLPDSYTINSGESDMMLRESMNETEKRWKPTSETKRQRNEIKKQWKLADEMRQQREASNGIRKTWMPKHEMKRQLEPGNEMKKDWKLTDEIKKLWKSADEVRQSRKPVDEMTEPWETADEMRQEIMAEKPATQSVTTSKCKLIFSKMLKIWDEWKQKMKADQPKENWLVVRPEDDEEAAAPVNMHAQIHPTICLTDYREHPEGLLLYEGYEHFDNICLGEKTVQVGQSEESDIKIAKDTISRMHARIEYREEEYYLEDLNSTNGTFVNDEPLSYKQEKRLKTNDIVRFADVKYRFV